MVEKKNVSDLEFEAMQKVMDADEERSREAENEGRLPRRPPRRNDLGASPPRTCKRVMTSDMQEITGTTEVDASDLWINGAHPRR